MLTDSPPRRSLKSFRESDQRDLLPLPADNRLLASAAAIEAAMKGGDSSDIQRACSDFLRIAAVFYSVPECTVRVLAARPLWVREYSTTELFGDYHPSTLVIRVWKKTAIRKEITSFGTFLSTLCHEFCHHLDFHRFGYRGSWHTRGFYGRTALLYHHAKATPVKKLIWMPGPNRRWRIDWQRTNRGR
jgi:hypothetical protein